MLLRIYSLLTVCTIAVLVTCLAWLARLPLQSDFRYDAADPRFVLVGYIDFVFLIIVTLIITLTIWRPAYEAVLQKPSLGTFDRALYRTMYNLPLILICCLCAFVLLAVFVAFSSYGAFYF